MAHRSPITPPVLRLDDEFHCRYRHREISLQQCLDDFVEANAFDFARHACFKCPLGLRRRCDFADGMDAAVQP
jgi:hypothetical protein